MNNWFNVVGKNVINAGNCIACSAFKILQVSLSKGTEVGLGFNSRSDKENKLNRCWSLVFTVEYKLNSTEKIFLCESIQFISGPAF